MCCAPTHSPSSPTEFPPPPPSGLASQEVQPQQRLWAEHLQWPQRPEALGTIQGRSEAWGHFTAGPSFYLGHSRLELPWISLPQMPSNVCSSPECSSGLLCLSLLNRGDKMVDETRGLVTSVFGDMCNFLTCMWPKHLQMQHLENREWLQLFFFFFKGMIVIQPAYIIREQLLFFRYYHKTRSFNVRKPLPSRVLQFQWKEVLAKKYKAKFLLLLMSGLFYPSVSSSLPR